MKQAYRTRRSRQAFQRKSVERVGAFLRASRGIRSTQSRLDKGVNNLHAFAETSFQSVDYEPAIEAAANERKEQKKLIQILNGGDRWSQREAKVMRSCKSFVRVSSEGVNGYHRSCNHRFCVRCFKRAQAEKRKLLQKTFAKVAAEYSSSKFNLVFLTLTINPKKVSKDCRKKLWALRKHLTRFLRSRSIKRLNEGCYYRIETGKKNDHFHHHVHLAMVCNSSRRELEQAIRHVWKLGEIFKIKAWDISSEGSLHLEMSKGLSGYLVKPLDTNLAAADVRSIITAFRGVRINGATGAVRLLLKEAKEELAAEQKELTEPSAEPMPPEGIEPLPNGDYQRLELLRLAANGNAYAVYCLALLRWLTTHRIGDDPQRE